MPDLSYRTDEEADARLNPAESSLSPHEQAAFDQIEAGYNDDYGNDNSVDGASDFLKDKEDDTGNKLNNGSFYKGSKDDSSSKSKNNASFNNSAKAFLGKALKNKGATGVIMSLVGGGGILMSGFGPAGMLINIGENFTITNDPASSAKQIRSKNVVFSAFDQTSERNVLCNSSKLKCKSETLSYKALKRLADNNVTALNSDGTPMELKKSGYPDKNPQHYSLDGKKYTAQELKEELLKKENRKNAYGIFGRKGAFKMHVRAWTGKHFKNRVLKKLGLGKDGGITKFIDSKKTKMSDRIKAIKEKAPKLSSGKMEIAQKRITDTLNSKAKMAKRGGVAYSVAVASCLAIEIPKVIAIGVAAVQLVQVTQTVMDTVLSPASQNKAAGFDKQETSSDTASAQSASTEGGSTLTNSGFTPEHLETIGTMLTEVGVTEGSSNERGAAVDSKIFLAALGVNKANVGLSSYIPGYGAFNNKLVRGSISASETMEPACRVILSPAAMYASMAAEAVAGGFTLGLSTVVSFVGKVAIGAVIDKIIQEAVTSEAAQKLFVDIASNDMIPKARYRDLGDVLGIGAAAFFSSGSMGQMLPALTTEQMAEFNQVYLANEQFQKEMDIAALSPFDTSSRYTFLGNIKHNLTNMMLANGQMNNSISSVVANVINIPSMALSFSSTSASAAGNIVYPGEYCNYGEALGYKNDSGTPAVNMAGLPCTGILKSQASMSTEEAISIAEEEGWLDESKEVKEDATIEDLMESGYFKKDTPLYDFIETCGDASTGNYWTDTGGCTIPAGSSASSLSDAPTSASGPGTDENGNPVEKTYTAAEIYEGDPDAGDGTATVKTTEARKLAAIPVLLLDFQVAQAINGEDEEEADSDSEAAAETSMISGTPDNVESYGNGWSLKPNTDYSSVPCASGTEDAGIFDVSVRGEDSKIRTCNVTVNGQTATVASLISNNIKQMMEAAQKDGITLEVTSSFRSKAEQEGLYRRLGSSVAAPPGYSQHELGLAVDWNVGCGGSTCPGMPVYDWMMANASKYGFYKISHESWHFSTSGW